MRKRKKQELIQLTKEQLKELRKEQWKKQNKKCAILDQEIDLDECVMDHKHKLRSEKCGGPDGLGCIRGVLQRQVNVFEGKVERLWKRLGLSKIIDLATLLKNCALYIENPPLEPKYIYPGELKIKKEKLTQIEFNRICKFYFILCPKAKKLPKKSKYKNDKWKLLLEQADNLNNKKQSEFTKKEKLLIVKKHKR